MWCDKIRPVIVSGIDDLRMKRDQLQKQVIAEQKEKKNIEADVKHLTSQLCKVSESLANKISARRECDIIIAETRAVYTKVVPIYVHLINLGLLGKRYI